PAPVQGSPPVLPGMNPGGLKEGRPADGDSKPTVLPPPRPIGLPDAGFPARQTFPTPPPMPRGQGFSRDVPQRPAPVSPGTYGNPAVAPNPGGSYPGGPPS